MVVGSGEDDDRLRLGSRQEVERAAIGEVYIEKKQVGVFVRAEPLYGLFHIAADGVDAPFGALRQSMQASLMCYSHLARAFSLSPYGGWMQKVLPDTRIIL